MSSNAFVLLNVVQCCSHPTSSSFPSSSFSSSSSHLFIPPTHQDPTRTIPSHRSTFAPFPYGPHWGQILPLSLTPPLLPLPLGHHLGSADQQQAGHPPHVARGTPGRQVGKVRGCGSGSHPHRSPPRLRAEAVPCPPRTPQHTAALVISLAMQGSQHPQPCPSKHGSLALSQRVPSQSLFVKASSSIPATAGERRRRIHQKCSSSPPSRAASKGVGSEGRFGQFLI